MPVGGSSDVDMTNPDETVEFISAWDNKDFTKKPKKVKVDVCKSVNVSELVQEQIAKGCLGEEQRRAIAMRLLASLKGK